jgi:hypothetical protein
MNTLWKTIQKSFDLLDQKETKQSSFITALEYMLKIANKINYDVADCNISSDKNGDIIITFKTEKSKLVITANQRISYDGTGPHKEDKIKTFNTESYYVSENIFDWLNRNRKKNA